MGFGDVVQMVAPVLAPLHLLAFSTLLGTELYQTFVITKVCYNALPRSAFTTLQKHIFPLYFQGQTALLVVVAATVPPHGPVSFVGSRFDWVPLLIAGVTAGLNFMLYGPRTRQAMIDRIHQDTRDTQAHRSTTSASKVSEPMQRLNRVFSGNHAMSIHLNLVTIGATLWYGWRLGSRLEVVE